MLQNIDSQKTYYSISEVCQETGLEQHVLRYWETEFPQLKPKKNRAGNRAYRKKDIKLIKYIKHLLYNQKFTIRGAKKKISETRNYDIETQLELTLPQSGKQTGPDLSGIKKELKEALQLLENA